MGWVLAWRGYVTQRFISVQKHFSLTIVTTPAPCVLAADVFGTGIFHRHLEP